MAKEVLMNYNCNTIVTLCNNFIQLLIYVVKKKRIYIIYKWNISKK